MVNSHGKKRILALVLLLRENARSQDVFSVRDWSVRSVSTFAVGHSFEDKNGSNATLREVSGCRFFGNDRVALIGDDGEVFTARLVLNETNDLSIEFETRVLLRPSKSDWVDSESLTFIDNSLFVSSEMHNQSDKGVSDLAVSKYDLKTGQELNAEALKIPHSIKENVVNNKGFEALTALNYKNDTLLLLTTTEGPLQNDDKEARRYLLAGEPGSNASIIANYQASLLDDGTSLGVVDFEALSSTFLSLERSYNHDSNTIRLYEVAFSSPKNTTKKLIFEWTKSAPLGNKVKVDNYEGLCLFPNATIDDSGIARTHLLLVNDDNQNTKQLGTQFVVLDFSFHFDPLTEISPPSIKVWRSSMDNYITDENINPGDTKNPNNQWLWLLPAVVTVFMVTALCLTFRTKQASSGDESDGIELASSAATKSKNGARYGRVDHDDFSILPIDDDDDDDDRDYI